VNLLEMVQIAASLKRRIHRVIAALKDLLPVEEVYLFGSQACGTPDEFSDIDLAVFSPRVSHMSLTERAHIAAAIQKEFGDDLDVHLLPYAAASTLDPASFSAWVMQHGVRVTESSELRGGSFRENRLTVRITSTIR